MRARWLRDRTLHRLHAALEQWDPKSDSPPAGGWIRAVRLALGMTSRQLAHRLRVSHSTVQAAQRAEVNRSISLATLERYAAAMECRVLYVILPPEGSLQDLRERRAGLLAFERVWMNVSTPVGWRDEPEARQEEVQRGLLLGNPSKLWR